MPLLNREMTKRLRDIFYRPGFTVVPGGCLPIHAIMTEKAGYEAFYISGGLSHSWLLGVYDSGLITPTEFVENAQHITQCVNIPVFSDADTAGGNAVNVYRTVKDYIHAGLAGCHIEDVQYPKGVTSQGQEAQRRGHENTRLVSIEEAVGRLKAAIEARNELDPNFVIIGRTDCRSSLGGTLEEAIRRGQSYEKAGVDVVMFDSLHSQEEARTALKSVGLPAFCTGSPYARGLTPRPTAEERAANGEKIVMEVGLGWRQASQIAWETLVGYKDKGVQVEVDFDKRVQELPARLRLPPIYRAGFEKDHIQKLQDMYLPKHSGGEDR